MTDMDQSVLNWMLDIRTPGLTDVVTVITHSGGTVAAFVISTVVTVALLLRRYTAEAVMVAGAMLSGWAAMSLLKLLFGRERPPVPERLVELDSYSFHRGPDAFNRDREKDLALRDAGIEGMRFTDDHVHKRHAMVLARIAGALARRAVSD